MSIDSRARTYLSKTHLREKPAARKKVITTTLGDLVAAVTDEVKPFVRDRTKASLLVSYILNHVLTRHRLRPDKEPRRNYPRHFGVTQSA
jgi:hypothetical protein